MTGLRNGHFPTTGKAPPDGPGAGQNRGMPEVGGRDAAVRSDLEPAAVEVDLDGEVHRLRWPRWKSLVDTMLDAGIQVPHSCREGHCGSCVATLVAGEVDMASCDILGPEERAEGLILCCQARPVSDDIRVEF